MGLFNGFVTLPQIVMSLGFGWVMRHFLDGNRLWALGLGGAISGLCGHLNVATCPNPNRQEDQTDARQRTRFRFSS